MNIQKLKKVKKNPIYHLQKVDKLFSASKQAWLLFKSSAEMFAKKRLESFLAIPASSAAIFISSPAISVSFPIILDSGSCSTYAMWQLDVWRGNTKPQNCSSLLVIRTNMLCFQTRMTTFKTQLRKWRKHTFIALVFNFSCPFMADISTQCK